MANQDGSVKKLFLYTVTLLSVVCNKNCVETEKHFLLDHPLYEDLRLILFLQCSQFIEGFNCLNRDQTIYSYNEYNSHFYVNCF